MNSYRCLEEFSDQLDVSGFFHEVQYEFLGSQKDGSCFGFLGIIIFLEERELNKSNGAEVHERSANILFSHTSFEEFKKEFLTVVCFFHARLHESHTCWSDWI